MIGLVALAQEQGAGNPTRSMPGRYLVLGLILLVVFIYLFLLVLGKSNKSVGRFLEFFGFRLTLEGKKPARDLAQGAKVGETDRDRPGSAGAP